MNIIEKIVTLENEASSFGFKWETPDQIIEQIRSEIEEIKVHLKDQDRTKLQDEIGDLLHAAFSLCVFCQLDPVETMTQNLNKFEKRFRATQQLALAEGLDNLNGQSFKKLMQLWDQAKLMTK